VLLALPNDHVVCVSLSLILSAQATLGVEALYSVGCRDRDGAHNADCSDTAADFFVHDIKVNECVVDCLANLSTHASAGNKLASSVVFNH
jgi:hypothetical protein